MKHYILIINGATLKVDSIDFGVVGAVTDDQENVIPDTRYIDVVISDHATAMALEKLMEDGYFPQVQTLVIRQDSTNMINLKGVTVVPGSETYGVGTVLHTYKLVFTSMAEVLDTYSLENRNAKFMNQCFVDGVTFDKVERNYRFFEEAAELVQALGMSQNEAHELVDYVYGRKVGDPIQEVGGVMVTLAALCYVQEMSLTGAWITELDRVETPEMMERIRQKQRTKPRFSPLPGTVE